MNWTREDTKILIKLLKESPCLYDAKHPHANDKTKKNECLSNMRKRILPFKPYITVEDLKAKIRTLKAQLFKEDKRMEELRLKGYDEKAITPVLWCYKELAFLDKAQSYIFEQRKKFLEKYMAPGDEEHNTITDSESNLIPGKQPHTDFCTEEESQNLLTLGEQSQNHSMESEEIYLQQQPQKDENLSQYLSEMHWTREETKVLISFYKKAPCLYDPQHEWANDKLRKKECLHKIQKQMAACKPFVTVHDIKLKIKTLRTQLYKQNKKRERSLKLKTNNEEEERIPVLWCYEELSFLDKAQPYSERNQRKLYAKRFFLRDEEQDTVINPPSSNLIQENQPSNIIPEKQASNLIPEKQPEIDLYSEEESQNNSMPGEESQNNCMPQEESQNLSMLEEGSQNNLMHQEEPESHSSFKEQPNTALMETEVVYLEQQPCGIENFCQYLCTELKRIKTEDVFDELTANILEETLSAIAEERALLKKTAKYA